MQRFSRGARFLVSLLQVLVVHIGQPAMAQEFEKEGMGVGLGVGSMDRLLTPGRAGFHAFQPFDVLQYDLNLRLAMTDENLHGRMEMTILLQSETDSLLLNEALLTLDTVTVDGVVRGYTVDSLSETFTIDLGGMRNAGDTLRVDSTRNQRF